MDETGLTSPNGPRPLAWCSGGWMTRSGRLCELADRRAGHPGCQRPRGPTGRRVRRPGRGPGIPRPASRSSPGSSPPPRPTTIDPAGEGYPDLIALPDEPYWVRTKLTPGTAWVEPDHNLPGTHRPEGVIALSGAGITPGRTLRADLPDVTPTILKLLGQPIPGHVEGKPLACLADLPTTRQDPGGTAVAGPHLTVFEYAPEEQAIIEQRLADLGYE